nr:PREDICTED: secreted frizzled-related protein 2 [Struthio camelus australis]
MDINNYIKREAETKGEEKKKTCPFYEELVSSWAFRVRGNAPVRLLPEGGMGIRHSSTCKGRCSRVPDATCCSFLPEPDEDCLAFPAPKVCDACKNKNEDDNDIVENLCKNDFALKIKVKEIAYINGDTKITPETKSKTIYKLNGLTERDLRKIVLWLKGGLQCTCDEMNDINVPYLVMGQKQAGELVITSLKRWQKGQRAFKRFSRSIRKLQC